MEEHKTQKTKRRLIAVAAVIFLFIMLVSSLIGMIYESPLSIFLPKEEGEDERAGYELVAEEALKLYLDLETIVNNRLKEDSNVSLANSCSRENMADVIAVYAALFFSDEENTVNPCEFEKEPVAAKNRRKLKKVFDSMNTYSEESKTVPLADGDMVGRYFITFNDDSICLNDEDDYGECLVSNAGLEKLPLNTVVNIGGLLYRVAGSVDGIDDMTISVCKKSSEQPPEIVGKIIDAYFVSTPLMPVITHTVIEITYHNYNADYYISTYGFTPYQMEYFNEIADNMDEIAEFASGITNSAGMGEGALEGVKPVNPNESQKEFIESIGAAAVRYYPQYKILPSLTIAQAILESGWGKSGLAAYHNYFGMKHVEGCGTSYVVKSTQEQLPDGKYITIDARFRAYRTREEGIKGYYDFLQYPRYQNLAGVTDYVTAANLIREDGWATSLSYSQNLQRLIVQYCLTDYDKKAGVGK